HGYRNRQTLTRLLKVFKLTTPSQGITGRQFNIALDDFLCFGDKTGKVSAADITLNQQSTSDRISTDFNRSLLNGDVSQLGDWNLTSLRIFDFKLRDPCRILSPLRTQADLQRETPLSFEDLSHRDSAYRGDGIQYGTGVDPIAG